ncbi:tail fiber assembly protein [Limnobaculum parvum]|uniref:Tail fiber assembly protein n=1 Tax=Limnobaculum parvum TaxID=2172103 RepID=A0A2Y9TWM4_9GAMM|nr:tail fiber assembly protein [Limnobaculum parvum]AWH88012.1 tail fiber assembly protein [Limnobaculum parvum]
MNYIYSAKNNAFYPIELKFEYENSKSWPDDGVAVSDSIFNEFSGQNSTGKIRASDSEGVPIWREQPPLTPDELIMGAENKRKYLIIEANDVINKNNWPSKLILKRLLEVEKISFNEWLDYIDALNAIDTSTAPNITWPIVPA